LVGARVDGLWRSWTGPYAWNVEWTERNGALHRDIEFDSFSEAMAFMVRVGFIAEELQHHPEWSNVYNRVSIKLTTHDAGNMVTDIDRLMAARIDDLSD